MSVERMSVDAEDVVRPSWEQIADAVRRLDGETLSNVFLSGHSEFPWLSISGGKDDRVTVQFARGVARLFTLRNFDPGPGQITMVLAGQRAALDATEFVSKALALEAAAEFWKSETADPRLTWDPA